MLRQTLLLLHLLSAITWLGGMFFAYFCLRPAAVQVLAPPQRLPLWVATFDRFLRYMALAVLLLLATGTTMFVQVGVANAPPGWHAMATLGVIMAAVYAYLYAALFPKLRAHCEAAAWPAAAQVLNRMRQGVALNLVLGGLVVLAAVSAR
ncbi:CopD family protein [Aquabacterium sp.]|uniref:CopD family protein n=1 Tax=Aquabacterium sp. TaxID=1872578 RepID=UPI00378505AD